jgi:phosphopantothenoylcysteine decarboxylase/phosphopantothenate--cysteine ligase
MKFHKVIVTSGPTREWIDPVRYISNASSGKMGFHIAQHVLKQIPNLVYIHGGVKERYEKVDGAKCVAIETTIQLRDAMISELEENTLVIMAAAPADFRPLQTAEQKIKKKSSDGFSLELTQNPDVLASIHQLVLERKYKNTKLVGFAAETENLEENAISKLQRKGLSFIIGNYVGLEKGFGEGNSGIHIYSEKGMVKELLNTPKDVLASEIVDFLIRSFSET